jgi:hypothetical protein
VTLWTLISSSREQYVGAFREALRAQREKVADLATEVFATPEGLQDVPEAYRVFRVDLLWRENDQPRIATLGIEWPTLAAPVVTNYPDGRRVVVRQFKWDDCVIRVAPAIVDDSPLQAWLLRWSDRQDANAPDADGLRSAGRGHVADLGTVRVRRDDDRHRGVIAFAPLRAFASDGDAGAFFRRAREFASNARR